jgi:predicted PurR-regulated permease PerM
MPDALPRAPSPAFSIRTKVPAAETPGLRSLTTLAGAVVIVAGLYLGRDILVPVTLAILLSLVLAPLIRLLRRARLGRVPSVIVGVLIALGIISALGTVIGSQLSDLADDMPRYQYTINNKLETVRAMTIGRVDAVMERVGRGNRREPPKPAPSASSPAQPEPAPILVEVREPPMTPMQMMTTVVGPVVSPLAHTGIILIVTIFVLLQREDLRDRLIRLFGSTDLHRTTVAMDDAAYRLSRFFLTQLALNAGFGAVIGLGLMIIGLPSPLLWGIIAGLLRFVPYVGAALGALLPVALAAAVDPGWSLVFWTAGLFLAIEPVVGHIIEPLAYGHSTGMSPVSVVLAAIFWSWIWGPIGLILATPLTLCLVVLGRHVDRLEFLDVLLGDRPALTPVENFYQRTLAGDPDEAQDQAELLLKERSLCSYYDEVALKGLFLATADVRRGLVTPVQLERIREAVTELAASLQDHPDVDPAPVDEEAPGAKPRMLRLSSAEQRLPRQPAPLPLPDGAQIPEAWRQEGAILCIAGRGPLDEVSAQLLAQILGKHGMGTRVVPHAAVSRRDVGSLEVQGVRMICICSVQLQGAPSHLRYLVQRLGQRLPGVPVVVGVWSPGDPVLTDEKLGQPLGAQHLVTSLREAVMICGQAALAAAEPAEAPALEAQPAPA